jgi:hypothetical protein
MRPRPDRRLTPSLCVVVLAGAAVGFGLAAAPALAQTLDRQYAIKATFLHYLTQHLQWTTPPGKVQIATVGKPQNGDLLFDQTKAGLTTAVQWSSHADAAALLRHAQQKPTERPHLVFLFRGDSKPLDDAVEKLAAGLPEVVLVTEQDDRFRKGVSINFYEDKAANRMRVQLRNSSLPNGVTADKTLQTLSGVIVYP